MVVVVVVASTRTGVATVYMVFAVAKMVVLSRLLVVVVMMGVV